MERYLIIGIGVLMLIIYSSLLRKYFSPWLKAKLTGHPVTFMDLAYVVKKGANPAAIVDAYVACRTVGAPVSVQELTTLYLASPSAFTDEVRRLLAKLMPKGKDV